jgi:hypothetical protein
VNRGDGVQEHMNAGVVVMCWGGVCVRGSGRGARDGVVGGGEAYDRTGCYHCLWAFRADTATSKVGCHSGIWGPGAGDSKVPKLPGDGGKLKIGLLRHHIARRGLTTS